MNSMTFARRSILAIAAIVAAPAARAGVDVIQLPAMCGTRAEVLDALSVRMPGPEMIGVGTNAQKTQTASLLTGNGYWALLATTSEGVCIVASGFDWVAADDDQPAVF